MALVESHTPRVERFRFTSFAKDEPAGVAVQGSAALEVIAAGHHQQAETLPPLAAEPDAPLLPPPPPTFSEEELNAAKQAAYKEGVEAGEQQADAKRNKEEEAQAASLRSLLEVISNRITLASGDHAKILKNQQELILKLSLGIARKIAGDALKREPYASVEALLKECAGIIGGQERIVIMVAPQKAEGLRQAAESLQPHLQNFEGTLEIEGDESLSEQDCRIEWKNGQATRNTETLWHDIETLLKKTVLTS